MAKSITKPKNVIPTVVILDPAANKNVSRIQESYSVQSTTAHESSIEIINGQEIPVATDEQIQDIIDNYRPNTSTIVNDNVQENTNNGSNGSSSSSSSEEFDESNMISATDEQIWDIINNYGK